MRPARFAALSLCCSLVALAGLTAVVAAPPPAPVCGVCGSSVENVSISGSDGPGTLDIYVDETGDSLWHARVPVTESAAERYRANATALEAAVDDAWPRYHVAEGDVRTVETALGNRTVVVNYTVDDVARRGVGDSWLLEYFHEKGPTTNYDQQARRVTIHAPDGTVITNRPADASVAGNAATWRSDDTDSTGSDFDEAVYVTYGEGGLLGAASGYATIGIAIGPPALARGLAIGAVPGALIGLFGVAIGRYGRGSTAFERAANCLGRERPTIDAATLERLLVAVGVGGAVGVLAYGAVATGRAFPPAAVVLSSLGVGYALLGSAAARIGSRLETRGLFVLAALATVVAAGYTRALAGGIAFLLPFSFGFATALFLPIGHAFERGRTPAALLGAVTLVPSAVIAIVYPMRSISVWTVLVGTVLFLPWVAVVALFGYPLALLGRTLAAEDG
ncbi:hypothetical protein A6E15_11420 [Natrinema saccharevitans]|uniref:Uncharacterized protein n=1 Tax=Natrinema saccharevitans TaxID=301967 RepID=A0A1S8AYW2_9EURY|nr:hypothetical protein [Natrinema saccharevitans]OLZ41554.1 hypothetical protein A6E15_11420 [Natrinema saccharevitans]